MGLEKISLFTTEARQQRAAIYEKWLNDELPEEPPTVPEDSNQRVSELPTATWGATPQAGTF